MEDVVGSKIPDLMDVPLADLAKNEDLLAALRHALAERRVLPQPVEDITIGPGFSSSI